MSRGEAWSAVLHHTGQVVQTLLPLLTQANARGQSAVGVEVKGRWEDYVSADLVPNSATPSEGRWRGRVRGEVWGKCKPESLEMESENLPEGEGDRVQHLGQRSSRRELWQL